jgi:hypothetical protein
VGNERAGAGPDTATRAPESEPASGEFNVPDVGYLFQTPAGVLAAQRLVGNQAVQALLSAGSSMKATWRGDSDRGDARPAAGPGIGSEYTARLPIGVSRDATTAPPPGGGAPAVAGDPGQTAQPLDGGPGQVAYTYSKNSTQGGSFQFTDPDYNTLMATLTARMGQAEIGNCLPSLSLVLNGITVAQDGSSVSVPDETAPVKTGTFTVADNITLPTWTNVGSPTVQDAQRTEWNRYAAAVAAHEDLHATDDKATYDPVGATLGQKKIGAAIDAVSAATTAANAKAGPRDGSNPPPTLNPAGNTQVP